jgi:hypothetical protein
MFEVETYVWVQARDERNVNITHGGADVKGELGTLGFRFVDNENGTYLGHYTPDTPGTFNLSITINGENVHSSPFPIAVLTPSPTRSPTHSPTPAPTRQAPYARNCRASGLGLSGAQAGRQAKFSIFAIDFRGDPLHEGGDMFVVKPRTSRSSANVVDCKNGTYDATYVIDVAGFQLIDVLYNGNEPIQESPFQVAIQAAPVVASASTADGPGVRGLPVYSLSSYFSIIGRDQYSNPSFIVDISKVSVRVNGPGTCPYNITLQMNGVAHINYTASTWGDYTFRIWLNNEMIRNSPFTITLSQQVSGPADNAALFIGVGAGCGTLLIIMVFLCRRKKKEGLVRSSYDVAYDAIR